MGSVPSVLVLDDCEVDLQRRCVMRGGDERSLSTRECAVLSVLASREGEVVPRAELLVEALGYHPRVVSRALDMTIQRLRQKIELQASRPMHILTVRGVGYMFRGRSQPRAASTLVGRDTEFATLERKAKVGYTAVVGPPGIGKTALVAALAARWEGRVLWLDATRAHSVDDIAEQLALMLKAKVDITHAAQFLSRSGASLLCIDGPDHVDPDALEQMLSASEVPTVVAARRVPSEYGSVLSLSGLPPRVGASLLGHEQPRAARERLSAHLEGNPLALRLARPMLEVLSADDLIELLGSDADPAIRLDALSSTVLRSLSRLDDGTLSTLRHAAAFGEPFDARRLAAVLDEDVGRACEALERLRRESLVVSAGQGRVITPAIVAGVVHDRTEPQQRQAIARRHAQVVVDPLWEEITERGPLCRSLEATSAHDDVLRVLAREQTPGAEMSCRAALCRLPQLVEFAHPESVRRMVSTWTEDPRIAPDLRWIAQLLAGEALLAALEVESALAWMGQMEPPPTEVSAHLRRRWRYLLAYRQCLGGDVRPMLGLVDEWPPEQEAWRVDSLRQVVASQIMHHRHDEARRVFSKYRLAVEGTGDAIDTMAALNFEMALHGGNARPTLLSQFKSAIRALERTSRQGRLAVSWRATADSLTKLGEPELALVCIERATEIAEHLGRFRVLAHIHQSAAFLRNQQGRFHEARTSLRRSLALADVLSERFRQVARANLALSHVDTDEAEVGAQHMLALLEDTQEPLFRLVAAIVFCEAGRLDEAEAFVRGVEAALRPEDADAWSLAGTARRYLELAMAREAGTVAAVAPSLLLWAADRSQCEAWTLSTRLERRVTVSLEREQRLR